MRLVNFPSYVRCAMRSGAWLMVLGLVLASCASGPSYGAARKKKKGCDCPHWNAVDRPGKEVHASIGDERRDRP
jgi:hypothetical protein